MERNPVSRFWSYTAPDGDCLVWTKGRTEAGYGVFRWNGRAVYAHRLAFFLRMGRWPEPLARHLPGCRNRHCVLHVVDGTPSENARDQRTDGTDPRVNRTHCPHNHPYNKANTYVRPGGKQAGGRICRTCHIDPTTRRHLVTNV